MFTYYIHLLFLFLYGLLSPVLATPLAIEASVSLPVPTGTPSISDTSGASGLDPASWRNHTIYFHVIMSDGTGAEGSTGYISDTVLQSQVANLNSAWNTHGFAFNMGNISHTVKVDWFNLAPSDLLVWTPFYDIASELHVGNFSDINIYITGASGTASTTYCQTPGKGPGAGNNLITLDGCVLPYQELSNDSMFLTKALSSWFSITILLCDITTAAGCQYLNTTNPSYQTTQKVYQAVLYVSPLTSSNKTVDRRHIAGRSNSTAIPLPVDASTSAATPPFPDNNVKLAQASCNVTSGSSCQIASTGPANSKLLNHNTDPTKFTLHVLPCSPSLAEHLITGTDAALFNLPGFQNRLYNSLLYSTLLNSHCTNNGTQAGGIQRRGHHGICV